MRSWIMAYGSKSNIQIRTEKVLTHYTRQSKFEGSDRQIRGRIVKILTEHGGMTHNQLIKTLDKDKDRVVKILQQLCQEGLVQESKNGFGIR